MDFETLNTDDLLRDIGLLSPNKNSETSITLKEALYMGTESYDLGPEILIVSIDVGDGIKDDIVIHENDHIESIVQDFALKHNLSHDTQLGLIDQIKFNLDSGKPETKLTMSRKEYCQRWNDELDNRLSRPLSNHPSICENSRKIMQSKIVPNVYERLHNDSLRNKIKNIAIETPKRRALTDRNRYNSCERLYNAGMVSKQKAENSREKIRAQREEEISKNLTFQPEINKTSKTILKDYKKPESSFRTREKHKQELIEKAKGEKLTREQEMCTFSPQINEMTGKILEKRYKSNSVNKFNELYQDAKDRQWRQEEVTKSFYESEFPFQPSLKLNYMKSDPTELIDRLVNSRKEVEEHIQRERFRKNELSDPTTGRDYFRPQIGRPPSTRRRDIPVWDHLYLHKNTKESEYQSYYPSQIESNPRSDLIYNKLKKERYSHIFNCLRPDKNGEISIETIQNHSLDPRLHKVIYPLLQELEMVNVTLDFEEFFDSLENLMKVRVS